MAHSPDPRERRIPYSRRSKVYNVFSTLISLYLVFGSCALIMGATASLENVSIPQRKCVFGLALTFSIGSTLDFIEETHVENGGSLDYLCTMHVKVNPPPPPSLQRWDTFCFSVQC